MRSLAAFGCLVLACSSTPKRAPGQPPTPASITRADPGGDAHDPHLAALTRQLEEPWGYRQDRDGQLNVPLVDWKNWKRVRYWAVEHFTGFKYGDDYHALNVVFVQDVQDTADVNTLTCMRRAEKWARPQMRDYDVRLGTVEEEEVNWHKQSVLVHKVDGHVDYGFDRHDFSAAWVAYPAYPHACLIFAFAVPWREHEETARAVRDRWIEEGLRHIKPLTDTRPYRK